MQKTGWSYLVWKRVSLWMWSLGGSQQPFSCVLGHFRHGVKRTNEQSGDPSASLLLTSEKAVFCNCHFWWQVHLILLNKPSCPLKNYHCVDLGNICSKWQNTNCSMALSFLAETYRNRKHILHMNTYPCYGKFIRSSRMIFSLSRKSG